MINTNRISFTFILILCVSLAVSCGRGSRSPVDPPSDEPIDLSGFNLNGLNPGSNHKMLGMVTAHIDFESETVEIRPMHTGEQHLNLSSFLNHPNCPNSSCLTWYITGFDPNERVWYIDMHLVNPTIFDAYDMRIQFMDLPGDQFWPGPNDPPEGYEPDGWQVVNPDSYSNIWDTDEPYTDFEQWMNPFIAFEKDKFSRLFNSDPDGAGGIVYEDIEELQLHLPLNAPGGDIVLVVDANYPGHCEEPYQIVEMTQEEPLNPGITGDSATVEVIVADWGNTPGLNDVSSVSLYIPDILGDGVFLELDEVPYNGPNKWPPDLDLNPPLSDEMLEFINKYGEFVNFAADPPETRLRKFRNDTNELKNLEGAPAGFYEAIVAAKSDDPDGNGHDTLYNKFQFQVEIHGNGGGGGDKLPFIVFSTYDSYVDGDPEGDSDIYAYYIESGEFFKLVEDVDFGGIHSDELEVSVSNDGNFITFISNYNQQPENNLGDFEVWQVRLNMNASGKPGPLIALDDPVDPGDRVQMLTDDNWDERMPDYSQDGQVIAYMSDEFGTWDIFVTDKNATFQNRVTTNFANDEAPTFDKMQLPGTYRIYWSSNRAGGGDYNIYWINPMIQESGSNKPVWQGALNAPGFDGYPSSSYYNNGIAWMSSRDGDPEIFYYQTGYEKPMQLTNNTFETDTFPAMSPDGSFMAFQSDREDYNIDIWVMTFEGKNPHRFVDGINPDLDPFYASVDSN